MTRVTVPSLLRVPACTFQDAEHTCPSLQGRPVCLHDVTQHTEAKTHVNVECAPHKQTAGKQHQPGYTRNPDEDWTFCEIQPKDRSNTTNTNTEPAQDSH